MAPAGDPASGTVARDGMLESAFVSSTDAHMPAAMHPARLALIATRRAWWVLALAVLGAQLISAAHHHAAGDASGQHVAVCDLCVAQASPAAPPPATPLLPPALPDRAIPAPAESYLAVLRDRPVPHSPRAPPLLRHA